MGGVVKDVLRGVVIGALFVFTGGAIGGVLGGIIAAVGTSIGVGSITGGISSLFRPKEPDLSDEFGLEIQLSGDPDAPRKIPYGEYWTAGTLRFHTEDGDNNEDLYLVIVLAGYEIDAVQTSEADGEELTLDGSGNVTAPSQWVGLMNVRFYLGTDAQTSDATLQAVDVRWTSDHRLRGLPYAIVKLTFDEEDLSSIPQFRFKIRGRKVYDPRLDTTVGGSGTHRVDDPSTWAWSRNAVLCANDFVRGIKVNGRFVAGMRVRPTRFDWANVIAEANICDENVALAVGGNQARYTVDGFIDPRQDHGPNLRHFEVAMAGDITFCDGKWRFFAGAYRAPTLHLEDKHFIGPLRHKVHKGEAEKKDAVQGVFASASDAGDVLDYPPIRLSMGQNGGFETGDETGWGGTTTAGTVTDVDAEAHTGQYVLSVSCASGGPNHFSDPHKAQEGDVIVVTGWARPRNSADANCSIGVRFFDSSDVQIGTRTTIEAGDFNVSTWQELSGSATAPATTSYFVIDLGEANGTTGQWWFDDIVFYLSGQERMMRMDFALVSDGTQAQRCAKLLLEREASGKNISCTTSLYGYRAVPGETINVSRASFGLVEQPMRVIDTQLTIVRQDDKTGLAVDLQLEAGPESLYAWNAEETAIAAAPAIPRREVPFLLSIPNLIGSGLLTNGGFETGTLDNWTQGSGGTTFQVSTTNPRNGTYKASVDLAISASSVLLQQRVPAPAVGERILVQGFAERAGGALTPNRNLNLVVVFLTSAGVEISPTTIGTALAATSGFQAIRGTVVVPATAVAMLYRWGKAAPQNTDEAGRWAMDDCSIHVIPQDADIDLGSASGEVGTGQITEDAASELASTQPSDGTVIIPVYSSGTPFGDQFDIAEVLWENTTGETVDVTVQYSAICALDATETNGAIGHWLYGRYQIDAGSFVSDGSDSLPIENVSPEFSTRAGSRVVSVNDGETITAQVVVSFTGPSGTNINPVDVDYKGVSVSLHARIR